MMSLDCQLVLQRMYEFAKFWFNVHGFLKKFSTVELTFEIDY